MYTLAEFEFTRTQPKSVSVTVDQSVVGQISLIDLLDRELSFPDYCGRNWDALVDCLSDIDPSLGREVVIFHASLPVLSEADLRLYFECLVDARNRRGADRLPRLRFVFRNVDREAVALALSKIGQ
jgi:RNAse (barnase) inhibitor barstar